MYLEKLEINGFKSFAHKASFDFKPGITSIVGPNGSGKSNVADAIRWVLGEQSLKLLRGKKSEDVIFSGSDKKARLGMAEVSLYFNNDKDEAQVGMSEICLTRRLYRNGDSDYLINQQKSRLVDIQMLLAQTGVANTSYSIIGQGMIDAFLLASSLERKEFFEEASGVKPLQIKRGQSLNKLEKTEENLETAQVQLNEISPRLNSLTRQVKRLEKRNEIEINLKNLQKKYYGALLGEIYKHWQTQNNELKKIVAEQDKIKDRANQVQTQIARLTKDSAVNNEVGKLQNEYQKLLNLKMDYTEKIGQLKIKQVQAVVKTEKNTSDVPYSVVQKIVMVLKVLKALKIKIKQALDEKNYNELNQLFGEQNKNLNIIDELLAIYEEKENKSNHTESITFEDEIKKLTAAIEKINNDLTQVVAQQKRQRENEQQERSQIWELQQNYQQEQQELNKISNLVNNLRVELARLETRQDDLEQEARQELSDLEELKTEKYPALDEHSKRELVTEIGKAKHQLELIGGIDPEIQNEYQEIKTRHEFLDTQIKDLRQSIAALEKLILELDSNIKEQFDDSFKFINDEFQKYFKVLFDGGKAKLTLIKNDQETENELNITDEQIEESELESETTTKKIKESETDKIKDRLKSTIYAGIEIEATPPGKKLKSINMLSGGERAMTSIALICAIISANPSPFVVLDEVDAALDEANSIRYAEILERLSHKSQFIIITHNRATMEKADILYGVTMGADGISTLLSLKLDTAERFTNR